jgi:hypothetical protein
MSAFPGAPRVVKGGIVEVDPRSGTVRRIVPLQYNPDTLTRTLTPRGTTGEAGDRSEALRLTGPPSETIKVDIEIDLTDQLAEPEQNPIATQSGLHPQLAALERLVYPESAVLQANNRLAQVGTLEIVPAEAPLTLFIWSKNRILPVRITEFSVTEEAFDPALNPIRARISLGLHVLSVNDLDFAHRGNSLFMAYHQQKEALSTRAPGAALSTLGISSIP